MLHELPRVEEGYVYFIAMAAVFQGGRRRSAVARIPDSTQTITVLPKSAISGSRTSVIDGRLNFWTRIYRWSRTNTPSKQLKRARLINRAATKRNTNFRTASASKTGRGEIRP
jgi:hypothetical protein